MPWKDFNLIVTANRGPESMSLLDLFAFVGKAEQYGFSRDLYLAEMIERLSEPFLMLIMSVLALILGWKFKLGQHTLFKAWWVLIVPLFPLLSLYAIETVRYLARLCIVVSLSLQQEYPLPLMLGFLALLFAGLSVYFFAQRSD
jgi:lipopolysaccharide export LptBFGC system permease protein LptF